MHFSPTKICGVIDLSRQFRKFQRAAARKGRDEGKTSGWEREKKESGRNKWEEEKERERRKGKQIGAAAYLQSTCILPDAWLQLLIERSADRSRDRSLIRDLAIPRSRSSLKRVKNCGSGGSLVRIFYGIFSDQCDARIVWVEGIDSDNTLVCWFAIVPISVDRGSLIEKVRM